MSVGIQEFIGFIALLAIAGVVLYQFYRKAKNEVPPQVAARMEAAEDLAKNKIQQVADAIQKGLNK